MTYRDAVHWLDARVNYERSGASLRWQRMRNLDRIRRLLAALGDPHRPAGPGRFFIHIAGTKGKGSTAHLLAAALRALGLRTGLYTSPHLADLVERIRVDGVPIPPARLAAHLTRIRRVLRAPALRRDPPTYFDLLTAAAFLEFRARGVEAAVVETGLGGRLDSTNVVAPALTMITNVDYDHTEVLGNTLDAIAREKAGIVKPGVPLVAGPLVRDAAREVAAAARAAGAPVWSAARELRLGRTASRGLAGVRFDARTPRRRWRGVRVSAPGRHQAENALLVLGALDRLEADGRLRVRPARVRRALAAARVPGRLEVRPGRPVLVVDAAHNALAARAVAAAMRGVRVRGAGRRVLLFAAAREKDARAMLASLAAVTDAAVMVRVDQPRMRPVPDLLAAARGLWPVPPAGAPDVTSGLRLARAIAGPAGLVLVTGSFYLAGALGS